MNKKTAKKDNTVIMSDKYLSESGLQGGKIIGEHIALGSLIFGIPLLIIGLYGLINMLYGWGIPTNNAIIILILLVIIIGLLMTFGGYSIYRSKNIKN
jgi:hypothetical protein